MPDIWFISDTHFGHKNILGFKRADGSPLRDFHSTWEMDSYIADRWNETVKATDKVYHLGDVAFTDGGLNLLRSLPGHKRLVRGNHDLHKLKIYAQIFEEIYGVRQIDRFWLTHVPMHPMSTERARLNLHGHLHANKVTTTQGGHEEDLRYFNCSVECINYTPINFDEIKNIAVKRNR